MIDPQAKLIPYLKLLTAVYALSAPSALGTYLSGAGPVLVKLQCRVRLLPYRRYYLTGVWRNWQPPLES